MNETLPSQRGSFIAKLGAWLLLAQILGYLIFGLAAMLFLDLDKPNPTVDIWMLFVPVPIGIFLSLIGAILIVAAITVFRFRSSWMYHLLSFYGPLLICIHFYSVVWNVSTPGFWLIFCLFSLFTGLFFFVFALAKKNEFLRITP